MVRAGVSKKFISTLDLKVLSKVTKFKQTMEAELIQTLSFTWEVVQKQDYNLNNMLEKFSCNFKLKNINNNTYKSQGEEQRIVNKRFSKNSQHNSLWRLITYNEINNCKQFEKKSQSHVVNFLDIRRRRYDEDLRHKFYNSIENKIAIRNRQRKMNYKRKFKLKEKSGDLTKLQNNGLIVEHEEVRLRPRL